MNELQIFKNELFEVGAKVENEQILFNVEQVAKCLGFTRTMNGKEYIRWERINGYLPDSCPLVGKGDLIPEPLVYKLAFKASNEVAEKFQDWLAIEVIPQIRKTGSYQIERPSSVEDLIIMQAESVKQLKQRVDQQDYKLSKLELVVDNEVWITEHQKAELREKVNFRVYALRNEGYENVHFQSVYGALKKHFGVAKYDKIPRKHFETSIKFVQGWYPPERQNSLSL